MPGFLIVPNSLKPIITDIAKYIIINPLVRTKFYIAIRLHNHCFEGRHTPFSQSIAVRIERVDFFTLYVREKYYFSRIL
jgi:hypothetical protein